MKSFIAPSYTFTPGASGVGTVNLSGISGFDIKYLVAVINQTRGVVIYSTGDTATRYTNLAGTTLTLNVDTSTHNSGDVLQVIYEVTSSDPLTNTQLRASAVPVSASSLPLPSGAATLTEQQSQTTLLGTIDADTGAIASSVASLDSKNPALVGGRVPVDGSGVTQPVSGTFWQATQPVSIASMPSTPVTGTFWQATQPVSGPLTNAELRASAIPVSGTFFQATQPVSAASLPLPTGAATDALQTSGNASLAGILADQDESVGAIRAMQMAITALTKTLGQMQPDTAARMRVVIDAISASLTLATVTTVSTVTTCSTLTNQAQFGGFAANDKIPSLMHLQADNIRRNISVT